MPSITKIDQKVCVFADLRACVEAVVSCHVDKVGFTMNWVGDEPDLVRADTYYCANCGEDFSDSWDAALAHLNAKELK